MKKLLVVSIFLASLCTFSQRELNIGVNGGITIGDIKLVASSAFGVDANYLFDWYEDFKFGPSLSAVYYSPKNSDGLEIDPFVYVPVGIGVRFNTPQDTFYVGGDVGYAIAISPNGDRGGIYFKPMVGYHIDKALKVNLFYSAVKKKVKAYSYIGLGITFNVFGYTGSYYSY